MSEIEDLQNALEMCRKHRDKLLGELTMLSVDLRRARTELAETTAALDGKRREATLLRATVDAVTRTMRDHGLTDSAAQIEHSLQRIGL